MKKLSLKKDKWAGNGWNSVDVFPYEYEFFPMVVFHLCKELKVSHPEITDILDGYATDLKFENEKIMVHMDNYTFSIATQKPELRDRIYEILQSLEI